MFGKKIRPRVNFNEKYSIYILVHAYIDYLSNKMKKKRKKKRKKKKTAVNCSIKRHIVTCEST